MQITITLCAADTAFPLLLSLNLPMRTTRNEWQRWIHSNDVVNLEDFEVF